jgi:hypothetical protein
LKNSYISSNQYQGYVTQTMEDQVPLDLPDIK